MTPEELKNIRLAAQLTQIEGAALIGVSRSTWRRLELGECKISKSQEKLVRILIARDLSSLPAKPKKLK